MVAHLGDVSGYEGMLEVPTYMSNEDVYYEILNAEASLDKADPFRDDRIDLDALSKELELDV